jgi:hypothetical protein
MTKHRAAMMPMLHERFEQQLKGRRSLWDRFGGREQGAAESGRAATLLDNALQLMEDPEIGGLWHSAMGHGDVDPDEQAEALRDLLGYLWVGDVQELHLLLTLAMATRGEWYAEATGGRAPQLPGAYSPHYSDGSYEMPRWLAEAILEDWTAGTNERLRVLPISRDTARRFIEQHHTQLPYLPRRQLYAVGAFRAGRLVAVATAGHPGGRFSRADNGRNVLELSRIASDGTVPGASSMLAAFLLKAAPKSKRGDPREPWLFVTYSLGSEEGATYRALADLGLRPVGLTTSKGKAGGKRQGETGSLREQRKVIWEAGPAAGPAVDVDGLLQEVRAPLYFASGSNEIGYIRGLDEAGHAIGVAAPYVTRAGANVLREVSVPVFVDSGAFSEVEFKPGRGFVKVREMDWLRVLAVYNHLVESLGSQLYVVAPDRVGDQDKTLVRMARYAPQIQSLHRRGANIIVPIQRGRRDLARMWRTALEALGLSEDDPRVIAGIPSKKDATPIPELEAFLQEQQPRAVHFLGLGPKNARWPAVEAAVRRLAPGTRVLHDSAMVPAMVGRTSGPGGGPRKLTAAQDRARAEIQGQRFRSPQEADVDYTEMMQDLSWLPAKDRKRIAAEWGAPSGAKGFEAWFTGPDGGPAYDDVLAVLVQRYEGRAGAEERKRRSIREVME